MSIVGKLRQDQIPPSYIWRSCESLVSIAERRKAVGQKWSHFRSVTWADDPYRYLLTEYNRATPSRVLHRPRVQPFYFQLNALSKERAVTGGVIHGLYGIGKRGVTGIIESEMPHWTTGDDSDVQAIRESADFAFDHGLVVPNAEDELRIGNVLSRAYMDGVEPYHNPALI